MKTPLPHKQTWLILFAFVLCTLQTSAQSIDPTFQSPAVGAFATSHVLKSLSDGKVYVAGNMQLLGTKTVPTLVRLRADGTLDPTFKSALPGSTYLQGIEVLRNGELLVYDAHVLYHLKRDGKMIKSMYIGNIGSIAVSLLNDIYVCGYGYVLKFDDDFVQDTDFSNYSVTNGWIRDIAIQGTKLIIAGNFDWVLGETRYDIARLSYNGRLDKSFQGGSQGSGYEITSITVQPDKTILFDSYVDYFDGYNVDGIIRLTEDGLYDRAWDIGNFKRSYFNPNTRIFYINNQYSVYSMNEDGSWGNISTGYVSDYNLVMDVGPTGITVGNAHVYTNGGVRRIGLDNQWVAGFEPAFSRIGTINYVAEGFGRMYIQGEFQIVNGHRTNSLAALNMDGSVITSFSSDNDWNYYPQQIEVLEDNSVLVPRQYGQFLYKVDQWGDIAGDWQFINWPRYYASHVKRYDNNTFVYSGLFSYGACNANGSQYGGFATRNVNSGYYAWESDVDVQLTTGKVVISGYVTNIDGEEIKHVALLNTNGSLDTSFEIDGVGPNWAVADVVALHNDEILAKNGFSYWNEIYTPLQIAKLKSTGEFDTDFNDVIHNQGLWHIGSPIAFRDKIVAAVGQGSTFAVKFIDYKGRVGRTSLLSRSVTVNEVKSLYAPDNNSLYVVGDVSVRRAGTKKLLRFIYDEMDLPQRIESESARATTKAEPKPVEQVVKKASIQVFPNPAAEFIKVEGNEAATIKIYSLDGQLKINTSISGSDEMIDVRSLKPGRYVVKVNSKGKQKSGQFIIR